MSDNYESYQSSETYSESDSVGGGNQLISAFNESVKRIDGDISTINTNLATTNSNLDTKETLIPKQSTAPSNPAPNQIWIDTTTNPPIWKQYVGSQWVKLTRSDLGELTGTISAAQITTAVLNAVGIDAVAVRADTLSAIKAVLGDVSTTGAKGTVRLNDDITITGTGVNQYQETYIGNGLLNAYSHWTGSSQSNKFYQAWYEPTKINFVRNGVQPLRIGIAENGTYGWLDSDNEIHLQTIIKCDPAAGIKYVGRVPSFTFTGTINQGSTNTITHNLGYKPFVDWDGTMGNVILTHRANPTNPTTQTDVFCFSSGGNNFVGTINFF